MLTTHEISGSIPSSKVEHSATVASLLASMAYYLGLDAEHRSRLTVMGYIHDLNSSDRFENFSDVFPETYCLKEIQQIHAYDGQYSSDEFKLLCLAETHVTEDGRIVSVEEKLEDAILAYGSKSNAVENLKKLMNVEIDKRYYAAYDAVYTTVH